MRILLTPDAPEGGGNQEPPTAEQTGSVELPAGPPAAETVLNGTRSEREIELEQELEAERQRRVKTEAEKIERERTIAELQDQLHALRNPPKPSKADDRSELERFLAGEEV